MLFVNERNVTTLERGKILQNKKRKVNQSADTHQSVRQPSTPGHETPARHFHAQ